MALMPRTVGCIVAASLCFGIGVYLLWATATADANPALRVPPAIGYLSAALFVFAGLRLLQLYFRRTSEGNGFAALIAAGFAAIGGWIAIGRGARACGVGSGEAVLVPAEAMACRLPFGIGALLVLGMALYAARRLMRASRHR